MVKFKDKIVNKISTVNLERQLLHALISERLNLQRSLGKHKSDFFTNNARLFIYECITRLFEEKKSMLTKELFDFEIQKRFNPEKDKQRIDDFVAEFDLIKETAQTDNIENIISTLEEVQLGNAADALIREAYEKLESGAYVEAAKILKQKSIDLKESQKEGRIINLHRDSDDWFEEVERRKEHPELYAGIPTGFEKFDKLTGGLFPAELTIVFGLSGKGKSTFMKALTCNIRKQGRVVLHCGNEENEFQIRSKYMSADSGEKYSQFKKGTYTEEAFKRLKKFSDDARNVGSIYIYEFPQQTDATWIERAYRYLEMQGVHVDVIVIDYLDLMKPISQAFGENDEQGKITSDLKQIAINCNCPVITATQAGTSSEKQEKKAKPFLTAADVFGTKRKVHSANTLIGIVNQTATALANELSVEQRTKHKIVLCVPKNRDGAVFTFRQILDVECGKFYEDTDDDDPVAQNLEKQSLNMISDDPEKFRPEIDYKEIQQAQKEYYDKKLEALTKNMNSENNDDFIDDVSSSYDDDFINEASDSENNDDFIDNISSSCDDDFINENNVSENNDTVKNDDLSAVDEETEEVDFVNEVQEIEDNKDVPEKEIEFKETKKKSLKELLGKG